MKTRLIISESGAVYFVDQVVAVATAVGAAVDHGDNSVTLYSINTNGKQYVLLEMEVEDANDVVHGSEADFLNDVVHGSEADFLLACRGDEVIDLRPGTYHHELFKTFVIKAKETQTNE